MQIVRAQTPVRLNDIGGWTDTWFAGEGKVLNLAAGPGVEVEIHVFPNDENRKQRVKIHARDFGETIEIDPEKPDFEVHPLLQAAASSLPFPRDLRLEISIASSIPPGSAVGTSAAVCVALLGGLNQVVEGELTPDDIAAAAHRVETEGLGLQSGIQDQICAAMGGISYIHMPEYPHAVVEKVAVSDSVWTELDARLSLIYLGAAHSSTSLHEQVIGELERGGPQMQWIHKLKELPDKARHSLEEGDLTAYGQIMIDNNECQRSLHPGLISRDADAVIAIARNHEAAGWKVNGAGGEGGSLSILGSADAGLRQKMLDQIESLGRGIRVIPVTLSRTGLKVTAA